MPKISNLVSDLCRVCLVFPPLVSLYGLFPVLVSCHYEFILFQVCVCDCVNYPVYLSPVCWVPCRLVYSLFPVFLSVYLALSYLDVVIKDYYFEVSPRLHVPRFSLLCAPWQKTRPNSKHRPFTSFCFVCFFKWLFCSCVLSTANSSPPARRWINAPRRSREITPPFVGKANPPSAAPSSSRGKPTRRPRSLGPPPAVASSSPPAPAVEWSSQPVMVSPAGRGRILTRLWPKVFLTLFLVCLAPEGSWYPWAAPWIFFGGVQRSRLYRPGRETRPLPRGTTGLGLLSSLLHLGLRLSVPLWRPHLVYVSVSVLRGLQSAHPPSLVVLLRRGTRLPGGGSYVRPLSCVSCVPASCFLIWFVSCPRFMSLWVYSVPGVCLWLC